MSRLLLLVWLAGCWPGADPELSTRKVALDAWRDGQAKLEKGDADGAIAAFDAALEARPDDALLMAWKAEALARKGDLPGAIQLATVALDVDPSLVELRYQRGTWRAKSGDLPGAAKDLDDALQGGLDRLPRDVLDDPDYAPYLADPAFEGVIPLDPLIVAVEGPDGALFVGSDLDLRLRIGGARADTPIGITPEAAQGPIHLTRVVEDDLISTEGPFRDIRWRFTVDGPGMVSMGPIIVAAGTRVVSVDGISVEAKAPPGFVAPTNPPPTLPTPREVLGTNVPPSAAFSADRGLVVGVPPDARVEVDPPQGDPVIYELRTRGELQWTAMQWPNARNGATVTITKDGAELLVAKVQ